MQILIRCVACVLTLLMAIGCGGRGSGGSGRDSKIYPISPRTSVTSEDDSTKSFTSPTQEIFTKIVQEYELPGYGISEIKSSYRFLSSDKTKRIWIVGRDDDNPRCLGVWYVELYDTPKPKNWLGKLTNLPAPKSGFVLMNKLPAAPYWAPDEYVDMDVFAFYLGPNKPLNYAKISSVCCDKICDEPKAILMITDRDTPPPIIENDVIFWSLYGALSDGSVRSEWISTREIKFEIPDSIEKYMKKILANGLASCDNNQLCSTIRYQQYQAVHIEFYFVIKDGDGKCPQIRMIMENGLITEGGAFSWISGIQYFYAPLNPEFDSSEYRTPRWKCSGLARGCMVWETSQCDMNDASGSLTWT